MADIKVRGYVHKPATKTGPQSSFSSFSLSEGIKQKDGSYKNVFYNVTDFKSETPPESGSRVEIEGWLKPREYETNGIKRLSNDINCQKLEVLTPPKAKPAEAPATDVNAPPDEFADFT